MILGKRWLGPDYDSPHMPTKAVIFYPMWMMERH